MYDYCNLNIIPLILNITHLSLKRNFIKKIENLCDELTHLDCYGNLISKIENLPNKITYLNLCDNEIRQIENIPNDIIYLNLSHNYISKIENLPNTLNYLNIYNNKSITVIENLPNNLKLFQYNIDKIKFIDNIPINWFGGKFILKNYNIIKRIQRKIKNRLILKNKSARIIQNGCENWLWKPICNDGKMSINMLLLLQKVKK